ncbi:MAG: hypothetical protein RIQ72_68 [Candidatus Parcubacteria bacterium]|jgi:hypothetical protein
MVDRSTLKNPNGLLPESEKTTELGGERRTWTLRDSPEAGTYTLQAIVDTKEKEKNESLAKEQNTLIDTESSAQIQNPQVTEVDLNEDIGDDTNENEAEAEEEAREEIEEENTRTALNQKQASLAKKESEGEKEKEGLSFGWFMIALIMALLFDGIGFLINFIPVIGQAVASLIITPLGLTFIWLMHVFSGVPFDMKAKSRLAVTGIIEFIPIIQVVPALTACVLLSKAMPMLEKRALDVANKLGGEQAEKLMQNQISHPNSAIMNIK